MNALEIIGSVVAIIVGLLVIVGAGWKWVVLPNLREQLIEPVQETRRQVMVNGNRDPNNPTLKDQLCTLQQAFEAHLTDAEFDRKLLHEHLANQPH